MHRLTDHLLIISFDCLAASDFEVLQQLPNFQLLLENASYSKQVKTIYPSVTYSCHATLVTGNYPNRHKIVTNTYVQPGKSSPDWYWHRRNMKGTTLFDEAKKAGMMTAALLWPVTARANIDYHIPEIFANRLWHFQVPVSLINGSLLYTIEMNRRFGHLRKGIQQPWLDDFITAVAAWTIEQKSPHLMLLHLVDLDATRHRYGVHSKEAHEALLRHDARLGKLMDALKAANMEEQTTIVAIGDHSAIDVQWMIQLNVLLKENGFITVNAKGKIRQWKAYCKTNDGSAYIYLNNPEDRSLREQLHALLYSLVQNENNGIEAVYTGEEAQRMGADGEAAFMVEACEGFCFTERHVGQVMEKITEEDRQVGRYPVAVHGYTPEKPNYETVFIAAGKGIVPGIEMGSMHLVDEGPTFARLLGLQLGETDGQILHEVIEE